MTKPLDGQHALITGASRGIGVAVAIALAEAGATLSLTARNGTEIAEVATALAKKYGVPVEGYAADASNADQVEKTIRNVTAAQGAPTILVNNAGGADSVPFLEETRAQWEHALTLNLTSTFLAMQAVLPSMLDAGYGRIINMGGMTARTSASGRAHVVSAKAGIEGFTRALALEFAKENIAVNCITPAAAKTRIFDQISEDHIQYMLSKIPRNRFLKVEEAASMVAWLCSEENSFTTGGVFDLSGGRSTY